MLNQWKSKRDAEVAKIDADYLEKVSNMTAGRDQYKEWYSQAEELDKERRAKFHKMVSPDRIFVHDESRGQQAIVLGPSRVCKGCRSRNPRVGSVQVPEPTHPQPVGSGQSVLGTHAFLEFHFPGLCWHTVLGFWCSRSFRGNRFVCGSRIEQGWVQRDELGMRKQEPGRRASAPSLASPHPCRPSCRILQKYGIRGLYHIIGFVCDRYPT